MSNNCPDNSSKSLSIINANISVQFESTHLVSHVAIRAHRKSPPLATLVLLSSNDNNCPVYCDVLCIKMIHCTNRGCFTGIDQRSNYNTRRLAGCSVARHGLLAKKELRARLNVQQQRSPKARQHRCSYKTMHHRVLSLSLEMGARVSCHPRGAGVFNGFHVRGLL